MPLSGPQATEVLWRASGAALNIDNRMNHSHSAIRTMALAVALTIPALSLAAPMSEVVTTRDDQDVHQQYGRDSVYAIQTRQPAQTESRYGGTESSGGEGFLAGIGSGRGGRLG